MDNLELTSHFLNNTIDDALEVMDFAQKIGKTLRTI